MRSGGLWNFGVGMMVLVHFTALLGRLLVAFPDHPDMSGFEPGYPYVNCFPQTQPYLNR